MFRMRNKKSVQAGYQIYRANPAIRSRVLKLLEELSDLNLNLQSNYIDSNFILGIDIDLELVCRQYLNKFLYRRLTLEIYRSIGSNRNIIFPLPSEVFHIFEKNDFSINKKCSSLLWVVFIIGCFFVGFIEFWKVLFENFNRQNPKVSLSRSAFFVGFHDNTIYKENYSENIVEWFMRNFSKKFELDAALIDCNDKNEWLKTSRSENLMAYPYLVNLSFSERLFFVKDILRFFFNNLFVSNELNKWSLFLFKEIVSYFKFKNINPKWIPRYFLFPNNFWLYRPLWTYYHEISGGEIIMYFYSTNIKNLLTNRGEYFSPVGLKNINFHTYIVWDEYQKKTLMENVCDISPNIYVVNQEIPYTRKLYLNDSILLIDKNKFVCTFFPVDPFVDILEMSCALPSDVYSVNEVVKTVRMLSDVVADLNGQLIIKTKRGITNNHHPIYSKLLKDLEVEGKIILVGDDVNIQSICKISTFVLGSPFTSAVKVSNFAETKSAYFISDKSILHFYNGNFEGISIIAGEVELRKYLRAR